jgi:LPXTG-motif cell wall-anchored protein
MNGSGDPLTILGLIGMAMALLGGVLFLVRKKPAL